MYRENKNAINIKVNADNRIYVYYKKLPDECVECRNYINSNIIYKINYSAIVSCCDKCGVIYIDYYSWMYLPNRDYYNTVNRTFAESIRADILREERINKKIVAAEKRLKLTKRKIFDAKIKKHQEDMFIEEENKRAIKNKNGEPLGKMPKQRKRSIYS